MQRIIIILFLLLFPITSYADEGISIECLNLKEAFGKKKINNDEIVKISNFSNVRNMGSSNGSSSLNDALIEAKLQSLQHKYDNRIMALEAKVIEQTDTIEKMNNFFDKLTKNLKTQTYDNFNQERQRRLDQTYDTNERIRQFYANQGKPMPDRFKNRTIGGGSGGSKGGSKGGGKGGSGRGGGLSRKGGSLATTGGSLAKPIQQKEPSLVSKSIEFAKKNPATAFLTLDALRKFLPSRSPFGVVGGRAGTRSAAR